MVVRCENLEYNYKYIDENDEEKSLKALKGVNLKVNDKEFVAVLGHNGSGKSTLAKHINGLLSPSEGVMYVYGYNTKHEENIWKIRENTGMVFQNPDNQIVATIVIDDVAFGVENLGIPTEEIVKRVNEAIKWVDMEEFKDVSPSQLSGGQKQRVAIAGILAMKPKCIVLDEPTAMLDPIGRDEIMKAIKKLNKEEGITIILITHFMEEAVEADRVVVIDDGTILFNDKPQEVFKNIEKLKEVSLEAPQMTEIAHLLKAKGVDISENIFTVEEMVGAICQLK